MSKKNKLKKAAKNGKLTIQPNLAPSANAPPQPVTTDGGAANTSPPADIPLTKPILSGAFPPPARRVPKRGPLPLGKGDVRGFLGPSAIAAPPARGLRIRPL